MAYIAIKFVELFFQFVYWLIWAYIILSWAPVFAPNMRYNETYQQAVHVINIIFEPVFGPVRRMLQDTFHLDEMVASFLAFIIIIWFLLPLVKTLLSQIILTLIP